MAYQEEREQRRIVVETPTNKHEAVRYPERSGVSGAVLAAIVVGIIALAAIIILFVMNRQQEIANANVASQPPQTTIVQQPAQQQPPIIVEQPAPQQPPVVINQPPATSSGGSTQPNVPDDSSIQAAIDKKLTNDPNLSALGITATVGDGRVTLIGRVKTTAQKAAAERLARSVKGVKSVDDQIIVEY